MIQFQAQTNFNPDNLDRLPQIVSETTEEVEQELAELFLRKVKEKLRRKAEASSGHFPVDDQNLVREEILLREMSEGLSWEKTAEGRLELQLETELFDDEEVAQKVLFNVEYGDPWLGISPSHVLRNAWNEVRREVDEVMERHQSRLNQKIGQL